MAGSFQSNDVQVKDILGAIAKGSVQLPDFQRGWVWDDYRIRSLIASITCSYPVGAVMFLEYGGDNVRFKYRGFTGTDHTAVPEKLVLDGQQRLTSTCTAREASSPLQGCPHEGAPNDDSRQSLSPLPPINGFWANRLFLTIVYVYHVERIAVIVGEGWK